MIRIGWLAWILLWVLLSGAPAPAQEYRKWEAQISRFQSWLEKVGPRGYRLWSRLDSDHRPYRLYVDEGFYRVDAQMRRKFVEIFSHYLAGHPEKFVLIDIFDEKTGEPVGELGWDGFKLYPTP